MEPHAGAHRQRQNTRWQHALAPTQTPTHPSQHTHRPGPGGGQGRCATAQLVPICVPGGGSVVTKKGLRLAHQPAQGPPHEGYRVAQAPLSVDRGEASHAHNAPGRLGRTGHQRIGPQSHHPTAAGICDRGGGGEGARRALSSPASPPAPSLHRAEGPTWVDPPAVTFRHPSMVPDLAPPPPKHLPIPIPIPITTPTVTIAHPQPHALSSHSRS
jgi:hypothetical protein